MEIMESPDAAAAAVAAAYSSFSSSLPPLVMAPDELRRVKFLCSFGGSILPRPLDGKLRYVGGETRIVSVPRDVTYEELMVRMRDLFDGAWSLKYQQPEEDLDALISVVNDDDVTNMMEEYDKLGAGGDGFTRLRIFLFSHPDHDSGASSTSPAGAQFDSSDERETERRYVDALNSPIDPSEQFLSQRGVDPGLHAQFNTPQQASVAHRYSDTEGPRSPVYHTPGHHLLHDPRDFPPSPSSRPHHPAFGETIDRISEEYMRQTPSQPPPHHPAFVESVVWLPPGGIPAENAGFPGNLGHIHNVCEPSNVCEHCLMAVRRNQLTAPEARFHDNMNHWNHWQPHLDHMNQEGDFVGQFSNSSCIDCTQLRDPYLINQENSSLDHRVYTSTNHHLDDPRIHYTDRLPVDRIGMNFPVLHGNFYDHHHHHHHVQLASEHRNEVEGAMQYGSIFQRAHVPPPVANFSRPPYEAPGQMAGNHLNKVFPISSPTTRDNENPNFLETSHATASKKSDGVKIPSRDELDREGMKKENSSKECSDFSTDIASSVKMINLEDHELSKKELSLHVSETTTSQEDLDADVDAEGPAINEIEPTVAEEEALAKGLQTVKNSDLEEIRELGSGTYGSVYHGKWKGSDVAIKRIKASCFSGKPSERKRLIADFWKEALILSSLHHPNVVSFYGIVRDGPDGSLATVTEFMVNGSLKQVLQKKDRTIDRRKRIIISMDAAFGMEYLHGKNIVHFDLKCENLLVNMRDPHRPVCKIGDLGLSKVKQKTLVSGGVRGTLPWMAPELLSGKTNMVSEKVDVYSFGVVMWELLTGEEPYADMHCASIIGGIVNNTLRPTIPTWCDPEWKSLMETCWSTDPADRPSFSDVSQRLRKMAAAVNVK